MSGTGLGKFCWTFLLQTMIVWIVPVSHQARINVLSIHTLIGWFVDHCLKWGWGISSPGAKSGPRNLFIRPLGLSLSHDPLCPCWALQVSAWLECVNELSYIASLLVWMEDKEPTVQIYIHWYPNFAFGLTYYWHVACKMLLRGNALFGLKKSWHHCTMWPPGPLSLCLWDHPHHGWLLFYFIYLTSGRSQPVHWMFSSPLWQMQI